MLCVASPFEEDLSTAEQDRMWKLFLASGTVHSAKATTLPFLIRRCERLRIPYNLQAAPGQGYRLMRADK